VPYCVGKELGRAEESMRGVAMERHLLASGKRGREHGEGKTLAKE